MKYLVYFAALIVLLSLNFGVFSYLKILGAVPNCILLFLVVTAIEKQNFDFVFVALVGGLFLDFYNGTVVGGYALSFLLIGFLLQSAVNLFVVEELKWQILAVIVVLSVAFLDVSIWGISFFGYKIGVGGFFLDWRVLRATFPGSLLYDGLLFYPIYFFANLLRNWISTMQYNFRHR
jgi:rod shape-determining protein MreD